MSFTLPVVPLAQADRLDNVIRGMRGRPTSLDIFDFLAGALVLAAFLAAAGLLSYWLARRDRHRVYTSPRGLFLDLCRVHALPWRTRWLLWRITRYYRLEDPARVFLEPELLEPTGLGPRWQRWHAPLEQLRGQLYAEPQPESDREAAAEGTPAQ